MAGDEEAAGRRSPWWQALPALFAVVLLASCAWPDPGEDRPSGTTGESFAQHCADGRPSLVDVSAHRRGRAVVVTWGVPRVVAEPRVYRVLRQGRGTRWDRVAQLRLAVDAPRRYVDAAAPSEPLRYGVVEVDGCGVGPICSPTGLGRRCAVATLPARAAD